MKTNFILENFDQYVREVYHPLNEARKPLTKDQVRNIIESLVMEQRKYALGRTDVKNLLKEIFGESFLSGNIKKMKKDVEWAAGTDDLEDQEFFKKIRKFEERLINSKALEKKANDVSIDIAGAIVMAIFYDWMANETYEELVSDIIKTSSEKNLSFEKIKKQIEQKPNGLEYLNLPPAILGYTSSIEVEKVITSPPTSPKAVSLLDTKQQKTLFLDNSWTLNPEVGKALRDNLLGVLERRKQGAYTKIIELSITSSASRYRNTKGKYGDAESLSWGQLAFKRAQVIHNMIKEILGELQIPEGDPIREELNKVATMNIKGSNGDGTSGPNPLPDPTLGNLRVGYYQTTTKQTKDQTGVSKFIDKDINSPEKVYIVQIDDLGNTISEPKVSNMPLLKKREDYDQYKFVNVIVKFEETAFDGGQLGSVQVTRVPKGTLYPQVMLEKKGTRGGGGGGWSFKVPKIPKINILSWFTGGGSEQCLICQCGEF